MNKLPFIVPELDINIRIGRIVYILNIFCGRGKRSHLKEIAILDFLLKYPSIFKSIVNANEQFEKNQNSKNLYVEYLEGYKDIKKILNVMALYGYVNITMEKELTYTLTELGKVVGNKEYDFFEKLTDLNKENIRCLKKISYANLDKEIRAIIRRN